MEQIFPNIVDATTWNLNLLSPVSLRWRQSFAPSNHVESSRDTRPDFGCRTTGQSPTPHAESRPSLRRGARRLREPPASADPALPAQRTISRTTLNNVAPRTGFTYSLERPHGAARRLRRLLRHGPEQPLRRSTTKRRSTCRSTTTAGRTSRRIPGTARIPPTSSCCRGCALPRTCPDASAASSSPAAPRSRRICRCRTRTRRRSASSGRSAGTMTVEADYVYVGHRARLTDAPINVSLQPGNRRELPVQRYQPPADARMGLREPVAQQRSAAQLLRTADGLHEAVQQPLAGAGHVHALVDQGWRPDAGERPGSHAGDVPGRAGPRRRVRACDRRPAPRAVFNGIWEVGFGFQLSGLYFYGSGRAARTHLQRRLAESGVATSELPAAPSGWHHHPAQRLRGRPDSPARHAHPAPVRLGGNSRIDRILEVFNVFNRANYGSYVTNEANANFGRPSRNPNVAYAPRMLQLGIRFVF